MIAVDTSVLIAIAICETDYRTYETLLARHEFMVGPNTLLETHLVLRSRKNVEPRSFVDAIRTLPLCRFVALDERHFSAARTAFDHYGKGQGHIAQLNFGDCLSYAMAKVAGVPLLFKGDDFRHTDIEPALHT
ncbi:MAG: type II toxin-antitoxin system VapC family toxin [Bosea sp. (in: a-proteobacteria)]